MNKNVYIPGVCNIGPVERRMRRKAGIAGVVITVVLIGAFALWNVPPVWRLVIFLPAMLGASGLLQDQLHFCVKFGMSGLFNFGDDLKKQESVESADFRRKDQRKAIIIIVGSAVLSVVITLISLRV